MADRYWVGGTGNWDSSTTTHWAASSGGAGGASVPTASDNVYFDLHSNESTDAAYTVTLTASAYCNNLDISFTGTTKVTIAGSSSLYPSGNVNFSGGTAQINWTHTGWLHMKCSSGNTTFNPNGIVLLGTFKASSNNYTVTLLSDFESAMTGISGYRISQSAAGKFVPDGHKVTLAGNTLAYSTNGWFEENLTLYDLTITGAADKTSYVDFGTATLTVTNNLVINGNSAANRLLIKSSVLGTQRTITAANVTVTNADFKDIKGAGAGSWDLSAITGGSGDCGGNTDITFTTADDWYWHEGTGNFSDYSKWYTATNGGGSQMASTRVPLPQDTLYFDSNSFDSGSQTVTQNMPRIGGMVWTGATNTPTFTTSTVASVFGSITLISGMNLTASTQAYTFEGRGSYVLTSATKSWGKNFSISIPGGSLTLGDDFVFGNDRTITMVAGTFDAADYAVTGGNLNSSGTVSKTLNMGNGLWTMQHYSPAWEPGNTLTVNAEGSTIKLTNSSNNDITFKGGANSKTYNNVWFSRGSSTATITITGANTFADLKDDGLEAHSILFPNSTTTVTSLTINGSSGKLISLTRTGTSGSWTIFDSVGTNDVTYCNISYSTAEGGATFNALTSEGNVDGGNNTGWVFSANVPIKIEKSLKYSVLTIPTAIEKSLQYIVKAPVAVEKTLKYTIKQTPSAIEKGLVYSIVTTPAATEKGLIYTIKSPVKVEKTLKYTVEATATAIEKSLKYCVLTTSAAIEKGLVYSILTQPAAIEKSLQYTIKQTPSALEKSLKYTILTTPTATEKDLKYTIITDSKIDLSLKYTILTEPSAIEKSLQYTIKQAPSAIEKSLKYTIITTPSVIEKGLIYDVLVPTGITKSLKYTILTTPSAIEKTLEYEVTPKRLMQKDLKYTVLESSGIQKSLEYDILTQGSETKSLQYTVLTNDIITKSLKYCVITDSKKTKSLTYTINSDQSITKGLSYVVVSRIKQEKELKYTILQDHKITKSLKYSVVPSEAISKSLKYTVVTPNVISLQLRICIKRYPYTKQDSPYTPYVRYT